MNSDMMQHAINELKLTNIYGSNFGKSVLNLLEETQEITNLDTASLKEFVEIIDRLLTKLPITPITESDFEKEEYVERGRKVEIMRCVRYPSVYMTEDGKYWDDRAVAYRLPDFKEYDTIYTYQTKYNSKREITLPYTPKLIIETIENENPFLQHNT
jgi:hypothetical protein